MVKAENESAVDLEVRLKVLQEKLVAQINNVYQSDLEKYSGVDLKIVTNEREGGSQALLLGSSGKWSGKVEMVGWDMGESPSLDELLESYADIRDEGFQALRQEENKAQMVYEDSVGPEVNRVVQLKVDAIMNGKKAELSLEETQLLDGYHHDRNALMLSWKEKRRQYIEVNKLRLSEGLFGEMVRVMDGLQNS